MYPNTNFLKYFPETGLSRFQEIDDHSVYLRTHVFIVIRKIIAEYHLDEIIGRLLGMDAGIFPYLADYSGKTYP